MKLGLKSMFGLVPPTCCTFQILGDVLLSVLNVTIVEQIRDLKARLECEMDVLATTFKILVKCETIRNLALPGMEGVVYMSFVSWSF